MSTKHVVVAGENLSKIALANGFRSWKSIYDAKENAEFRKKRPNPNLIKAGDELFIPDKKTKALPPTGPFELIGPEPQEAQIEFGFFEEENPSVPMKGLVVEMQVPPSGETKKFTTDDAGMISVKEPDIGAGDAVILTIRDPSVEPPGNYDSFGGTFATGHTYVIDLPEDPFAATLPIELARSMRRPERNVDGTPAADMLHGDYTQKDIEDIRFIFKADNLGSVTDAVLFQSLRDMATTLFATGKLEGNILRMIDRFEANTGAEYSDPDLTAAVRDHDSTKRFEKNAREELKRLIDEKRGDVNQIQVNEMSLRGRPVYSDASDVTDGLTMAINDTWAYDVDLTEYEIKRKKYKGKFRITLYDHFGLDRPDVEKKFGLLAGFRAWFALQHLQRFGFKPFVTKIELDYDFEGTVGQ